MGRIKQNGTDRLKKKKFVSEREVATLKILTVEVGTEIERNERSSSTSEVKNKRTDNSRNVFFKLYKTRRPQSDMELKKGLHSRKSFFFFF